MVVSASYEHVHQRAQRLSVSDRTSLEAPCATAQHVTVSPPCERVLQPPIQVEVMSFPSLNSVHCGVATMCEDTLCRKDPRGTMPRNGGYKPHIHGRWGQPTPDAVGLGKFVKLCDFRADLAQNKV